MKIALYIEDGLEQIVLTPESDTERGIVGKLHDSSRDFLILRGKFYECRGGWIRQGDPVLWRKRRKHPAAPIPTFQDMNRCAP